MELRLAVGVTAAGKSAGQRQIIQPLIINKVIPKTQKAVVTAVGFAWVCLSVTPVGKRVFLLIVATIPTVMRCMTPSAATVKKAAFGRSKSPAFAGTKTAANRGPSPTLPKGGH